MRTITLANQLINHYNFLGRQIATFEEAFQMLFLSAVAYKEKYQEDLFPEPFTLKHTSEPVTESIFRNINKLFNKEDNLKITDTEYPRLLNVATRLYQIPKLTKNQYQTLLLTLEPYQDAILNKQTEIYL